MTAQGKAALLELRDRLSKATGPDRDLDCAIAETVEVCGFRFDPATRHPDGDYWEGVPNESRYIGTAPAYTASLDSAVTLVPGGLAWWEMNVEPASEGGTRAEFVFDDERRKTIREVASTPALALCLARLEYELAKEGRS